MTWLLFCKSARNNCSISWASLRAVIVIVVAATIALAVDYRTNECVNEPTHTTPALGSVTLVVARGSTKVCRCQWVGYFQMVQAMRDKFGELTLDPVTQRPIPMSETAIFNWLKVRYASKKTAAVDIAAARAARPGRAPKAPSKAAVKAAKPLQLRKRKRRRRLRPQCLKMRAAMRAVRVAMAAVIAALTTAATKGLRWQQGRHLGRR